MRYKRSQEQELILATSLLKDKKRQNIRVNADAGSGKSTLLFDIAKRIEGDCWMLSFNSRIRTENVERAHKIGLDPAFLQIITMHSLGLGILRHNVRTEICTNKVYEYLKESHSHIIGADFWRVKNLVETIRGHGLMASTLAGMKRQLNKFADYIPFAPGNNKPLKLKELQYIMGIISELDKDTERCDFDDMCRLPVLYKMVKKYPKSGAYVASVGKRLRHPQTILVDEVQDLNTYQVQMIEQLLVATGAQLIIVGDDKQAIHGFRGAFSAMEDLGAHTDISLSLTTTFRCKSVIVEYVNNRIADSSMKPFKKGGKVVELEASDEKEYCVLEALDEGVTLMVSTRNKHLISMWIDLFEINMDEDSMYYGKALATLKGSKCVAGLRLAVKSITTYNWGHFMSELNSVLAMGKKSKDLEHNADIAEALIRIIQNFSIGSKGQLLSMLDKMEANSDEASLQLHTVHSAKGLEAKAVLFVEDYWDDPQVSNLAYVGLTRASDTLLILNKQS